MGKDIHASTQLPKVNSQSVSRERSFVFGFASPVQRLTSRATVSEPDTFDLFTTLASLVKVSKEREWLDSKRTDRALPVAVRARAFAFASLERG